MFGAEFFTGSGGFSGSSGASSGGGDFLGGSSGSINFGTAGGSTPLLVLGVVALVLVFLVAKK